MQGMPEWDEVATVLEKGKKENAREQGLIRYRRMPEVEHREKDEWTPEAQEDEEDDHY